MDLVLMKAGLKLMVYGLGGVFAVLIMFYISTSIMLFISKKKNLTDGSKS